MMWNLATMLVVSVTLLIGDNLHHTASAAASTIQTIAGGGSGIHHQHYNDVLVESKKTYNSNRMLQQQEDVELIETTMTSLEQLMTRAYQERIRDGTWNQIFGDLELTSPQPFCNGNVESWPFPKKIVSGSDLEKVLVGRIFKCGYVKNIQFMAAQKISSNSNSGGSSSSTELKDVILIGTNETHAEGLIVDYWNSMIDFINGEAFKDEGEDPIVLQWKLYDTPDEALNALLVGEIDSACGRWDADGTFIMSDLLSQEVSRLYVLRAQTW